MVYVLHLEYCLIQTVSVIHLFLDQQVWKNPCLPHVFIGCLCVLFPAPPLLHSRFFSIPLFSLSTFLFSFASLSFLIFSNFSSQSLMCASLVNQRALVTTLGLVCSVPQLLELQAILGYAMELCLLLQEDLQAYLDIQFGSTWRYYLIVHYLLVLLILHLIFVDRCWR